MIYTVAIIGSFQKYYGKILDIIKYFKNCGLYVISPKESFVCGRKEGFVLFDSDQKNLSPTDIQMITLNKIINADVVYVYNPGGYVGRTTCYEIGFCFSKKKPIYFLEPPDDLPIPVLKNEQILKPKELVNCILSKRPEFITNYKMCPKGEKAFCQLFDLDKEGESTKLQNIVICGSMMFYDEMVKIRQELDSMGIYTILPREEHEMVSLFNETQFLEFKKSVSRTYLKKIRDKNTVGVLIYNAEKNGIPNYIGANTLVELAMAFTWNRKIFLYNDIYLPLKDELQAWECICLNGNLNKIKESLFESLETDGSLTNPQVSLFDIM